jgi:hypothetical protein
LSESECKGNAFSDTLQTFHDLFSKKNATRTPLLT